MTKSKALKWATVGVSVSTLIFVLLKKNESEIFPSGKKVSILRGGNWEPPYDVEPKIPVDLSNLPILK